MSEDLYPSTPNELPSPTTSVETVASPETSLFSAFEDFPSLETIITHVVLFALVWSFLYSILCVAYFYFYNIKYHDRESERLQDGFKNGYLVAVKLWASNLVALLLVAVYYVLRDSAFRIPLGLLALLGYFVKLFYYDLRLLPEIATGASSFWEKIGQTRETVYSRLTQKTPDEKK